MNRFFSTPMWNQEQEGLNSPVSGIVLLACRGRSGGLTAVLAKKNTVQYMRVMLMLMMHVIALHVQLFSQTLFSGMNISHQFLEFGSWPGGPGVAMCDYAKRTNL